MAEEARTVPTFMQFYGFFTQAMTDGDGAIEAYKGLTTIAGPEAAEAFAKEAKKRGIDLGFDLSELKNEGEDH